MAPKRAPQQEIVIRAELLRILEDLGVFALDQDLKTDDFCSGTGDIPLSQLDADSLSYIQISIRIEDEFDVSVTPEFLASRTTLGQITKHLTKRTRP